MRLLSAVVDPPKVEETYNRALKIYEKLVKDYPENVDYRAGEAQCLQNLGPVVADTGRPEQAEAMYHKALILLETNDAKSQTPEFLRYRAGILSNLGHLRRPNAEDAFRRSIALSANLVEHQPAVVADIHNLADCPEQPGPAVVRSKTSSGGWNFVRPVGERVREARCGGTKIDRLSKALWLRFGEGGRPPSEDGQGCRGKDYAANALLNTSAGP